MRWAPIPRAVAKHFGDDIDFAVLNKTYEGGMAHVEAKRRYSPAFVIAARRRGFAARLK